MNLIQKFFVHIAAIDTAQTGMAKETWPSIACNVGLMDHKEQDIFLMVKTSFYADFKTFNVKVEEAEEEILQFDENWEIKTKHEESGFTTV